MSHKLGHIDREKIRVTHDRYNNPVIHMLIIYSTTKNMSSII